MKVKDTILTFTVDSGATYSVIRLADLPGQKLSGSYHYSVGSSGEEVKESFNVTLPCTPLNMPPLKH